MKFNNKFIKKGNLTINEKYLKVLEYNNLSDYEKLYEFNNGETFRKNKIRSVLKIELPDETGKKHVFHLKKHKLDLKERIKSLFSFGKTFDGENEWEKMLLLHRLDIPTMNPVAFGLRKKFFLPWQSLTLTEHIYDSIRLEEFIPDKFSGKLLKEDILLKRLIIENLALICKKFHESGLNHNDFYLGHFFIKFDPEIIIYIIDLQRVFSRKKINNYKKLKDISQLYFSSTQIKGINNPDRMRFFKNYIGKSKLNYNDRTFIKKVIFKSGRIAKHTEKMLKTGTWNV